MIDTRKDWIQLSQRQRMSPFPNYISMEAIARDMKQVVGVAYQEIVILLEQRHMYVYMQRQDHERVGKEVMKKVLAQPDMFVRLLKKQKTFERTLYRWIRKYTTQAALQRISNSRLADVHEQFDKRYRQIYSHYFPVLSMERYFFEYLRDYIYEREPDQKKASQYIDTLITERRAMVNWQERRAALRLAARIAGNKKWRSYFDAATPAAIAERVRNDKKLHPLVQRHLRSFFWITRDYEDPVLTYDDIISRVAEHVAHDPASALEKMDQQEKTLQQQIRKIVTALDIDARHKRLFQTMREGIYYKEYRKQIVSKALYYYDPILQEIAKRSYLTLAQVRHMKTDEVRTVLSGSDMADTLNERIQRSAWHVQRGKTTVHTANEAKKYFDYFISVDTSTKRFVGMPVSPGTATGPVKIVIDPDDFHKVKKGDVIATIQATPVFTRVLSIASALICDGGPGITSHPATLAREAGIPGVIGLATTTKVLKDGMRVSVDGDSGVVQVKK